MNNNYLRYFFVEYRQLLKQELSGMFEIANRVVLINFGDNIIHGYHQSSSEPMAINPFSVICIVKFSQVELILFIEQAWDNFTFDF